MKIYRMITIICFAISGYMGWTNFDMIKPYADPLVEMIESEPMREMTKNKTDWLEVAERISKILAPLLPVILARKKRNVLDGKVADVTEKIGIPNKVVRDKFGIGDRRKSKDNVTENKRRKKDAL